MEELYEFICPCGQFLIWGKKSAKVLCKRCSSWVEFTDLKNPQIQTLPDEEDNGQIIMFK